MSRKCFGDMPHECPINRPRFVVSVVIFCCMSLRWGRKDILVSNVTPRIFSVVVLESVWFPSLILGGLVWYLLPIVRNLHLCELN